MRIRKRLRLRRGFRGAGGKGRHGHARELASCQAEETVVVVGNPDKKTVELGLFSGAHVHVLQNDPKEPNMVVAVGDARYAISKEAAGQIAVQ